MALLALASSAVKQNPAMARIDPGTRRVRRFVVLWRRGPHAGDLRPFGGRGPRDRHAGAQAVCAAHRGRRRGRAVRTAAPGHVARRRAVRSGRRALVPGHRGTRRSWHQPTLPKYCGRSIRCTLSISSPSMAGLRSWFSARYCSPSPAPKRCTRTWGTSARPPSASPGSDSCFPRSSLNYFGQGALLIADPKALDNPFYLLAPDWALFPLVVLATAATVIASQATISGTYSLTKQAIQLDYLPRMNVTQTSPREIGQIYIRGANWVLLVVIVAAMVGFGLLDAARFRVRRRGDGDHADHDDPHVLRDSLRLGLQPVREHCRHRVLHPHRCGVLLSRACSRSRRAAGSRSRSAPSCSR